MAVETTIAFATLLLEDEHAITFHEGSLYLANNFCTFYGRCTNCYVTVGVNEQNLVEFHHFAFFFLVAEIVNIQFLASFGLELLSLNFYNCVHLINCKSSYTVRRPRHQPQRLDEPFGNFNCKVTTFILNIKALHPVFFIKFTKPHHVKFQHLHDD